MSKALQGPASRRGLTLLELLAALAVLAVLASLALPSMGAIAQRHRLAAAAEALAGDLMQARQEAARTGQALHLRAELLGGGRWCWSVSPRSDCGCDDEPGLPRACALAQASTRSHPGVQLMQPLQLQLAPEGVAAATLAELASADGQRLRVQVAALGRAHICRVDEGVDHPGTALYRYRRC